ncbi:peptidoglycan-N-acetylmuramic acid deacetylase [Sediminibacillus halophilus]|uniref:Peptidoglycan-N-acetylmuramic acid deacetylase n=2 Tax=Sediminibacillus halophilus TaxID=482461 RepID=A0A1G9N6U0_9BACI|nr:peptidoglycan-N-acetylmuramic acid deacetylase [Sediminibacillus halophilus]
MYDSKDEQMITSLPESKDKTVMLSFDDGPSSVLPEILDILKHENVPAMFFWQSKLLYPERPWKRLIQEGHKIGTHTITHPDMTSLDYKAQYRQMASSVKTIESITGQKVTYFRPPFGQYDENTKRAAEELGLTVVLWKIASIDWELKNNPQQIVDNTLHHLQDKSIILLHELEQTAEILPSLIQSIKQEGYRFHLLS